MANNINCTCGHSWSKVSSSKKDMNVCHICGKDNTMRDGGWLNKFEQGGMVLKQKTQDNYGKKANPNNPDVSLPPGFKGLAYNTKGRNYSPAWGGQFAMGGSLPGAVGFTYARTAGAAPSNGPYAKKTKASAQNGMEMKFYQEGLDFKPKTISQDGSEIPIDSMGYWNPENVGNPVIIPSNEITMEGVDVPLIGISDTGDTQMMYPGEDYTFDGESVTEYPVMQKGGSVPTTADSLKLFNAQIALNNFYDKEVKAGRLKKDVFNGAYDTNLNELKDENLRFYRDAIYTRPLVGGSYDKMYNKYFNLTPEQVRVLELKGLAQTKAGNANQQYYRDLITPLQNLGAPFAMIDSRIKPQRMIDYDAIEGTKNYPGGSVSVYDYDPLAIKPYNMRTPKEREEWKKKYGKPKPKPTQKTTKPQPKVEPKKLEPIKREEPIKKVEQPKPVERKQNIYEGSPVYSPGAGIGAGSTLVGFANQKGDTTYVKPEDYERFAVPKYGKEFIESKMERQRNGGVNNADAQPIKKLDQSLNFTNYNKPTKGGWLDKYN